MKATVKESELVKKHVRKFNDEEKHIVALDVRAYATIGKSILHDIYHFISE